MPGPRRVRRFQNGGSAENPAGGRRQPNMELVESFMARQGMSEEQKANYRRMLGVAQQKPAEKPAAKNPRSPLAQAVKPKKKKPIVRRAQPPRQTTPAPRQAAPTPPPPPPMPMQPPEQDGMLGETMNSIQQRQQMLQGLRRGGPVKKKAAPRRVVRAKRRR